MFFNMPVKTLNKTIQRHSVPVFLTKYFIVHCCKHECTVHCCLAKLNRKWLNRKWCYCKAQTDKSVKKKYKWWNLCLSVCTSIFACFRQPFIRLTSNFADVLLRSQGNAMSTVTDIFWLSNYKESFKYQFSSIVMALSPPLPRYSRSRADQPTLAVTNRSYWSHTLQPRKDSKQFLQLYK